MPDYFFVDMLRRYHLQTYYHSLRVSQLCFQVARQAGMTHDQCIIGLQSGLLHDVGKLKVPKELLSKKGKLSADEYKCVQNHVDYGVEMLKESGYSQEIILAVEGHHERGDGSGYPNGVKPVDSYSQLVAVCDVYDAMTERRSYKRALPKEYVLKEMESGRIGSFSILYVEALRYTVMFGTNPAERSSLYL